MIYNEVRTMRGPNMWSASYNKLIAIKFERGLVAELDANGQERVVSYFRENHNLLPFNNDFKLSAFEYMLKLASLLQGASMYHELVSPSADIYYGIVEYNIEKAGKTAVELASNIVESIIAGEEPIQLSIATEKVLIISREFSQDPTTSIIIAAASKRNIPVSAGPAGYTILGYGKNQKLISAAISHHTSCIAVNIAGNKEHTKRFLESASIPVPKGKLVKDDVVALMFKDGDEGRIPIVAITGTNGKTTTTRLMAHVAGFMGKTVGFSSTDGIYIGREKVLGGDCSGPQSARTILQDPTVDFAVLECARGGIIRSGLGFDQCDISIVTNVAADHLGLKDIYTVEDLANVKAVVPRTVKKEGWAILNAGDDFAYAMRNNVQCNVALFCSDELNEQLQCHLKNSGSGVYTDSKLDIYICNGDTKTFIVNAAEVPITRNGKAGFMIENVLPVVFAAYVSGFPPDKIADALKSFIPTADHTPGRINEFNINGVTLIVDYAHNPHGLKALAGYLKNIPGKKLGIITGTGDRRDDDIFEYGQIAATMYDDIIIRFDRDTRGRTKESIVEILAKGIHDIKPQQEYMVIPDTQTAIEFAVANAEKGSYVVICADNAAYTLSLTKNVILKYENNL